MSSDRYQKYKDLNVLSKLQSQLIEKNKEKEKLMSELRSNPDIQPGDFGEVGARVQEVDFSQSRLKQLNNQISLLMRVVKVVEDEDVCCCDSCTVIVPAERMIASPTLHCVDCLEQEEKKAKQSSGYSKLAAMI